MAFKGVTEELQTPEDYELITYRLMERLKAENVLHAEVYVSVGVCLWRKQDFDAIFAGLERGRERGERDFGVSLLWMFDAVRQFGAEKAQQVAELAARFKWSDLALAATSARPLLNCFATCLPTPRPMAFGLRRMLVKRPGRGRCGVH
jgi:adenosine deaminase